MVQSYLHYLVYCLKSVVGRMTAMSASTSYVNGPCLSIIFQTNLFSALRPYLIYLFFSGIQRPQKMIKRIWYLYPKSTSSHLHLSSSKSISCTKSDLWVMSPTPRAETNGKGSEKEMYGNSFTKDKSCQRQATKAHLLWWADMWAWSPLCYLCGA